MQTTVHALNTHSIGTTSISCDITKCLHSSSTHTYIFTIIKHPVVPGMTTSCSSGTHPSTAHPSPPHVQTREELMIEIFGEIIDESTYIYPLIIHACAHMHHPQSCRRSILSITPLPSAGIEGRADSRSKTCCQVPCHTTSFKEDLSSSTLHRRPSGVTHQSLSGTCRPIRGRPRGL